MKIHTLSMVGALALALSACGDSPQETKPAATQAPAATNAKPTPAAPAALPQVPTLDTLDARAEQEIATDEQADAALKKLEQDLEAEAP